MDRLSELTAQAREFDRAFDFVKYAQLLMKYPNANDQWKALREAEQRHGHNSRLALMLKATVAGSTTQSASDIVPDRTATRAWASLLSTRELAGRIPFLRAPFNSSTLTESSAGSAGWVGEGAGIAISKLTLASANLDRTKISGTLVFADETVQIDSADNLALISKSMIKVIQRATDTSLLDPEIAAVSGKNPASLTNGVDATVSTGDTEATITSDLKSMLQDMVDAGSDLNDVVIVGHPTTFLHMSTLLNAGNQKAYPDLGVKGGEIFGLPALSSVGAVSSGSPSERVLCAINPMGVLLADEGDVQIAASKSAAIQLLDNPTNNLDGTATSLVSLFQTGAVALRFSRHINFVRALDGAVSFMRVLY